MLLDEYDGKRLIAAGGVAVPAGRIATTADEARAAATDLGEVMVKAQIGAGGRGKAGGVLPAAGPGEAAAAAEQLLGTELGGLTVERVLVEARAPIADELYVAFTVDAETASPLVILSSEGGVDIESVHATAPDRVHRIHIDLAAGLDAATALASANAVVDSELAAQLAGLLLTLYGLFRRHDAELLEINPLAVTTESELVALDCKLAIDDNARFRQPDLPEAAAVGTPLERRAAEQGFLFVELDGDVGVLANGAGLTMATMDAVQVLGGAPANFLEVGGMAYKRATPALELVLSNRGVASLLVNLCGAYARTDVIAEGLIAGWKQLAPNVPVAFCIHGTGEERARALVRDELGIECHETMDAAVRAAIAMAAGR